jgi:hypothetical protein
MQFRRHGDAAGRRTSGCSFFASLVKMVAAEKRTVVIAALAAFSGRRADVRRRHIPEAEDDVWEPMACSTDDGRSSARQPPKTESPWRRASSGVSPMSVR